MVDNVKRKVCATSKYCSPVCILYYSKIISLLYLPPAVMLANVIGVYNQCTIVYTHTV